MHERTPPRLIVALAKIQARRPLLVLLLALISLVPTGFFAAHVGFRPDFAELLPDNKESVIEMRRTSKRLAGVTTLIVTAGFPDGKEHEATLRAFMEAAAPKLEALGPPWVERVDWSFHETKRFFDENKLLFAELEDLQKARDEVVERYEYEVQKEAGLLLEEGDAPPPITAASIRDRLTKKKDGSADKPKKPEEIARGPHPNGYYMRADGTFAAIVLRTSLSKKQDRLALLDKVKAIVAEVEPAKLDPAMEIGYTGDLVISGEEYDAIVRDLGEIGVGGVLGVLLPVFFFFWRARTILVMAGSLLAGLVWTFGLTYFTIGYLNSSTGFLISIIAGNGINYGIMYMARYLEARRDEGADVEKAIEVAHKDTWLPTLSASATTMLAYGSLILTDFRGFKHFGIIGGYGMLLCWIATYLFTPAMLAASERVRPVFRPGEEKKTKARGYYGMLFAKLAQAAPRTLGIIGIVIGLLSVGLTYRYFSNDPMEYDMRNIQSKRRGRSAALDLSVRAGHVIGRMSQDGMAVMVDDLADVPLLAAELEKRKEAAPADRKPFEKVVTINTLIPKDQEEKIPLIEDIQRIVKKARRRNLISDADWAELEPYMPKRELAPIGIADLPEGVARPFTEKDGTRGRIVYIVPKQGESVWNARYLIRWADSFRSTTLPNGHVIKGSGRAVIFADMIQAVVDDAPKAVLASAIGVIAIILLAFRGSPRSLGVFIPWLIGVCILIAYLAIRGIKLNFLNFIVLPITFGIGADYAHNLMQRYLAEGGQRLDKVFTETGGALVLCSLTTCIGYFALMFSINKGIASFGLAAAVGEIACLLSSVLLLPAFLVWLERRSKSAPRPHDEKPESVDAELR